MSISIFLIFTCYVYFAKCYDSDSSEINKIEFSPYYDTIIFNDIADIIKEFENNVNPSLNPPINSESESDENIEDLLSEYQHYLEKAHKQRKKFIEKTKAKKVPLLRHEKFTKPKVTGLGTKYNDYYYANTYYSNPDTKLSQVSLNSPLDLFIPMNPKLQFLNNLDSTTLKSNREDQVNLEKIMFDDRRIINIPPAVHKSLNDPIKSSCFCKNNQIPCACDCKQCLVPFDMTGNHDSKVLNYNKQKNNIGSMSYSLKNSQNFQDITPNSLNIRVKVDVQLPYLQNIFDEFYKNMSNDRKELYDVTSKESATTALNIPFPYFNFPIPLELLGYRKSLRFNKHDSSPMHKITIHKKKRAKINSNKKHRKLTLHNIDLEPQQTIIQHMFEENYNLSNYNNKTYINETLSTNNDNVTEKITTSSFVLNKTDVTEINIAIHTEEIKNVMLNIKNNVTEDNHKIANSIETEYTKAHVNKSTEHPFNPRKKRDLQNSSFIPTENDISLKTKSIKHSGVQKYIRNNTVKKAKMQLSDTELLYWPSYTENNSSSMLNNISSIIPKIKNGKAMLNMTIESIRRNYTKTVEKVIFGKIDWNDVNTVALIFMSYAGKHTKGILTFCSESICHSMKCGNKTCIYRTCLPERRVNRKGHCNVSNTSDSIVPMESIVDLPTNIAFETIDILQEKMLGKLFGKLTSCINSKCITVVASKKIFLKSKCLEKELHEGHCLNLKDRKNNFISTL